MRYTTRRRVTPQELREMFNRQIAPRLRQFDLVERTSRVARNVNEPPDTKSITYDIYRNGEPVAVVHAYVRSDGSLGASGQYDPKAMVVGGCMYFV